jgi:hypothetical protein
MVVVERLPLEVFIGSVSKGHRSTRQDVLNPPMKAQLFLFRSIQRIFDRFQNGANTQAIGFSVSIG